MPTITATPVPSAGLVQVDVVYENPSEPYALLERVNVVTGEVQTVRPHTALLAALGQYMLLSNGRGRWWDTDAPFDTPFVYRVRSSLDGSAWYSNAASITDTFTRSVASSWGTTTPPGATYASGGGSVTDFNVDGAQGTHTLTSVNASRRSFFAFPEAQQWLAVDITPSAVATGGNMNACLVAHAVNLDNLYQARAIFKPGGALSIDIRKRVSASETVLALADLPFPIGYTAGMTVRLHFQVIPGPASVILRAKVRSAILAQDNEWQVEAEDATFLDAGQVGIRSIADGGNTNVNPVLAYDNLSVIGSDAADAPQVTLSSEGHAWLRDPLRPCSSIRLENCVDYSMCADSNMGFEVGSAAGWHAVNGTLTAEQAPTVEGSWRGKLTVDYTAGQNFTPASQWSTILYNWTVDAQGWVGEGGTTSVARVTSPVHDGSGALAATKTGMGAGTESIRFNDAQGLRDLSANGPTLSVWVQVPLSTPGTNWVAHLEVQDPAFAWIPGTDVPLVKGEWRQIYFTPPAGLLANMRSIGMSVTGTGVSGTGVVVIDTVQQGASPAAVLDERLPVSPGEWVRASGWLMAPVATTGRLTVNWITGGGTFISRTLGTPVSLPAGSWVPVEVLAEAPAATGQAELNVVTVGTPAVGLIVYLDGFTWGYRSPGHEGAFFVSMDTESRTPNSSSVAPVNRRLGITASRPRRGVESTLTLATGRFEDRDALIDITEPGTPLLFSAPPEYGIPQRYWDVGTTNVARGLPDHRFQPRIHQLPIGEREAPAGPGKAPCGVSYDDACAQQGLVTWGEVQAAGMTWLDLTDVT